MERSCQLKGERHFVKMSYLEGGEREGAKEKA